MRGREGFWGLVENLGTGVGDKKVTAEEIKNLNGAWSYMYVPLLTKFYLLCLGRRVIAVPVRPNGTHQGLMLIAGADSW